MQINTSINAIQTKKKHIQKNKNNLSVYGRYIPINANIWGNDYAHFVLQSPPNLYAIHIIPHLTPPEMGGQMGNPT
jgi:hypothetical protein